MNIPEEKRFFSASWDKMPQNNSGNTTTKKSWQNGEHPSKSGQSAPPTSPPSLQQSNRQYQQNTPLQDPNLNLHYKPPLPQPITNRLLKYLARYSPSTSHVQLTRSSSPSRNQHGTQASPP